VLTVTVADAFEVMMTVVEDWVVDGEDEELCKLEEGVILVVVVEEDLLEVDKEEVTVTVEVDALFELDELVVALTDEVDNVEVVRATTVELEG
jgi:hypothetical protein